ncbi:MAG: DUF2442 domain-containing protein [Verrucomicrobia bacterium]|nr:DUF2442 domain-containing protein [Leptolyngbya sp. ES-bin-22]
MTSLTIEPSGIPTIQQVIVTDDTLSADLSDGRTIAVPLAWYLRLLQGSIEERNDWRLVGSGNGIHWNQLDEDISIKNLILGQPSGESQKSFQQWLSSRVTTVRSSNVIQTPISQRSVLICLVAAQFSTVG